MKNKIILNNLQILYGHRIERIYLANIFKRIWSKLIAIYLIISTDFYQLSMNTCIYFSKITVV